MVDKTNKSMEVSWQCEADKIRLWPEMQVSEAPRQDTFPVYKKQRGAVKPEKRVTVN